MNNLLLLLIAVTLTAGALAEQSLGDIARQSRAQHKPAATVRLDNETITPSSLGRISTGSSDATPADVKNDADQTGKTAEGKTQENKDVQEADKPKSENWHNKIDEQNKNIATLQPDINSLHVK